MRLVTYALKNDNSGQLFVGVYNQSTHEVLDVAKAFVRAGVDHPCPFTMKGFLEMGVKGRSLAQTHWNSDCCHPVGNVIFKAPIFDPEKVICIGMNYVDHCTEQNVPIPKEPLVFSKFTSAIASPGDDIILIPGQTKALDFEAEMVIVIGKTGKGISKEKAMEHVAGYTVAHDVSARDWQLKRNGGQWLMGKTFDSYAPIGPAIVTTDEIGDPHNLGIRCYVNGKTVQDSNTKQLVFKTDVLIEWISKYITLKAGDIILTGTPPGVGAFRKPQLWLKDGDVVRVEIDKIGSITNTVREHKSKM